MEEVGDGLAEVAGVELGLGLLRGAEPRHPGAGAVPVDEPALLVDEDRVGGDLGQQPVAVDQLGQLVLIGLLGGDVDDDPEVEQA